MAISGSELVYCRTLKPVGRKWVGRFTRNKQLIHNGLTAMVVSDSLCPIRRCSGESPGMILVQVIYNIVS